MATHSSGLAWRIPWTEEPGGLQSMGRKELDTVQRLTLSVFVCVCIYICRAMFCPLLKVSILVFKKS